MMRIAFSTVACPEWTLEHVARSAAKWGFDGVELRSFGFAGGSFVCDPGLTGGDKVRRLFTDAGVRIAGVASGCCLDAPIFPPVIGHVLGIDNKVIADARQYIDIASDCGAQCIRLFGFKAPRTDSRSSAIRRISDRLAKVCDHARHREVTVLLENGGSFARAEDIAEIIDRAKSPLARASYDPATALGDGECPVEGATLLGSRIAQVRVRDLSNDAPCPIGQGEIPLRDVVSTLRDTGSDAWLVAEWPLAWVDGLADAESVLPDAAKTLFAWAGNASRGVSAA